MPNINSPPVNNAGRKWLLVIIIIISIGINCFTIPKLSTVTMAQIESNRREKITQATIDSLTKNIMEANAKNKELERTFQMCLKSGRTPPPTLTPLERPIHSNAVPKNPNSIRHE